MKSINPTDQQQIAPMSAGAHERETMQPLDTKDLFHDAMKGNWREVVAIYKNDGRARKAKITRGGDTVLHIAVSSGKPDVVAELLDTIKVGKSEGVLSETNQAGNTALHLAASLGMVDMCRKLSLIDPKLITEARNKKGENPLFVAADVGKKDVFFVLQEQICVTDKISHCRRNDGNTILHRAIYGEYFELAFQIIHMYPPLVNSRNVMGETPLHLLAAKPSAFRSGNHIRFLDQLVYACVVIDPLKPKSMKSKSQNDSSGEKRKQTNFELPENYGICRDIFFILKMLLKVLFNLDNDRTEQTSASQGDGTNDKVAVAIVSSDISQGGVTNDTVQLDIKIGLHEEGSQSNKKDADELKGKGCGIPPNYLPCFDFLKTIMKFFLIILGIGFSRVEKIKRKKQKLVHAKQIMIVLVDKASRSEYENDGARPILTDKEKEYYDFLNVLPKENDSGDQNAVGTNDTNANNNHPSKDANAKQQEKEPTKETPILLAAKMGIVEIVKKISEVIPIAIQDVDSQHRNIVLLAALYRQPQIYRYMLGIKQMREYLFRMVDKDGNGALHLAASASVTHPWNIPGSALQMHWEIKWYKYVKNSMEFNSFAPFNNNAETARDVFTKDHEKLVNEGAAWLTNTSESCSVVAALIATVAFASATTIPGGIRSDSGIPALEGQLSFNVFAMSSLVALCFSVTSLVMFLSILTSRYQEMDFDNNLPLKLILGLTSLFMSIASTMVAFCGAHFYLIANNLKYAALPIYIVVCIPVTLFVMAQFPLYFDLIKATITHVPQRTYKKRSLYESEKGREENKAEKEKKTK